jgi:hypothetical protein
VVSENPKPRNGTGICEEADVCVSAASLYRIPLINDLLVKGSIGAAILQIQVLAAYLFSI